ncbi:MAG: phosphotransferase [Lachnospiraceae bacterium]|nr:phosphotransferase [Lachnospiraceae bacterium]
MEQIFKTIDLGDTVPFAKGGTGECYRLNEATILKLYYEGFPVERILREKEGARTALIAGVPTALSFDMVQVGKRQGVIYEFIQGRTLSEIVAQTPDRAEELGGMFAGIAAMLHNAEVKKHNLPSPTAPIRLEIPKIDYVPEETVQHIIQFMDILDKDCHYVHGDFHPNNIIMTKDGPMLIDMGGFSLGNPIFDLATLRFNLFESPEALKDGRSSFNGLTREETVKFWKGFEEEYFGGAIDPAYAELLNKVTLLKKIRFERLYGSDYAEDYCAAIRKEVSEVF